MSNIKTGGPAFPNDPSTYDEGRGMTLRDYFAAKAMQSAYLCWAKHEVVAKHWTTEGIAESAYAMADAMLAARSQA